MRVRPIRLDTPARKQAAIDLIKSLPLEPVKMMKVVNSDSLRTLAQNATMWRMLGQLEKRGKWHGMPLKGTHWKDLLTAGLEGQTLIPAIESGFVALGKRTSEMGIKEMSELIEFMYFFVADDPGGLEFNGFIDEVPEEYKHLMEAK